MGDIRSLVAASILEKDTAITDYRYSLSVPVPTALALQSSLLQATAPLRHAER